MVNSMRGSVTRGRKGGAKVVVMLIVLALASFFYYRHWRSHVSHVFHREGTPFAERLAEPGSFIYGSSIHVWAYEKGGETMEIAVTGHADESTCRGMSGLVNNAYLQKHDESGDLFVAGAARLSAGESALSIDDARLRQYLRILRIVHDDEGELNVARHSPTEGKDNESAIQQMSARLEFSRGALKQLESSPNGAGLAGAAQSLTALGTFVSESANVAADSGLVQVHTLPFGLAKDVRDRIRHAAAAKTASVVRFDDLLGKWNATEATLLVDVLRAGAATPLELRIPMNDLSADGFEEAKRANRSEVESSMVGDAERRRRFYEEERKNYQDQIETCRNLSAEELRSVVKLNERVSPDGFTYKVEDGDTMSRKDYCEKTIPHNLAIVGEWLTGVDELLKSIHDDTSKGGDSHIEAIDHATLVDSMLRDWKLPVARAQEAFDYWRERRRGPVWHELDSALDRAKVDREAINGEHVVFSVRVFGNELLVRPVHVLDLSRAVLVVDAKAGITRIADAWEGRTPVPAKNGSVHADQAKKLARDAIAAAGSGDLQRGRDLLRRGLSEDPTAVAQSLEQDWARLFRDDSAQRAQLQSKVKDLSVRQERLAVITGLMNSPDLKQDDDREFLRRLHAVLDADSGLPVDYHLLLAWRTAGDVAMISGFLVKRGDPGTPLQPWDVLETAMNGGLKRNTKTDELAARLKTLRKTNPSLYAQVAPQSSSSGLRAAAADGFAKIYEFDPEKAIKTSASIVATRTPEYFESARKAHGMPKEDSAEMTALLQGKEIPMFEWDATEMEGVRDQMARRSHADTASFMLWASGKVSAALVNQELAKATQKDNGITTPAFQSASERLVGFIKSGKPLDMLARLEIGQVIATGSNELLLRSKVRMESPKTERAAVLSTHSWLQGRVLFEDHRYAKAYDALYAPSTAVALYGPQIKWTANESAGETVDAVEALCDQGAVSVSALVEKQKVPILSLTGLSAADACSLAAGINGRHLFESAGRPFEQVLAMRVPLRSEAEGVRKLLADPPTRLAFLKAMVFGHVLPAENLVPPARIMMEKDKPAAVESYRVPTLDETARNATRLYIGAKN